jgi:hypothetical protein
MADKKIPSWFLPTLLQVNKPSEEYTPVELSEGAGPRQVVPTAKEAAKAYQEAALREQKRISDARKKYGSDKLLVTDAEGKGIEVPAEDMDEFLKKKEAQQYMQNWNKAFEESQAPFEMATSLAGMGAMAAPMVQRTLQNKKSPVSPKVTAALGALGSLASTTAEAMPTYLVKGAVEENQVKLDALKKGPLFMDPKLVQERIEQGGRDTLSFITPEGKQTSWTMVNSPGRSRGSALSRRYQDIMDSSFGNKRISMARQLYSDPEVRAFLEEEGLSLPDINAPTSGSRRQGTLVSQTRGQKQDTAEAGRQRWIEAGIEGYKRLQEAFRRKMKKGE